MIITRKNYQKIIDTLKGDLGLEVRFTTRVIFINNLDSYKKMVADLSGMADEIVNISDSVFCGGEDSVPNLKKVLAHIADSKDKNIVITSVGEYLRFAQKYESSVRCIHSIMTYPAHSAKRVWIPIYDAKDLFQDVVGDLPSERFELYELEEEADEFECYVYSNSFSEKSGIVGVRGLRKMFQAWDSLEIESGFSFSTKKVSMIIPTTGNYSVHVIESPLEYIKQHLKSSNSKLVEGLGKESFWERLASYVAISNGTLEDLLEKALNVASFDAQQVVSSWKYLSRNDGFGIWLLWLWYKLGLTAKGDYLAFAIQRAQSSNQIQKEIECAILLCTSNPAFDTWVKERMQALCNMGLVELSTEFWNGFAGITDERTKLKLLSNTTHKERTKIIQIISEALNNNKKIADYKSILSYKYPDLLLYFMESSYLRGDLDDYIRAYKQFKVMDYYDMSISENALDVDTFQYETRSSLLNAIKCSKDAYYLWIDGMGVEWLDMLVEKVVQRKESLNNPVVEIGMAVMPTTTSANMKKADPDTVSYKFDRFDSLSHIKDKSDCNYFSIIDKQFEMIGSIADLIVQLSNDYPHKSIVVTADHGMSRMAAKAFHEKQGITSPKGAEVKNLGRYCILPNGVSPYDFSHAYKEDDCLAFRDHSHFVCSGYAPGEIHGGASPEEWLVPVIVFPNDQSSKRDIDSSAAYVLLGNSYTLDSHGNVEIQIETSGIVNSLVVEQGMNTFVGRNSKSNRWSVIIPNLQVGKEYLIRVYLNNMYSSKTEVITVKRRGLDVDDDF